MSSVTSTGRRSGVLGLALAIALVSASTGRASAEGTGPLLEYRWSGSDEKGREFQRVMGHRAVQALLLDLAASPRTGDFVAAALEGTDVSPGQLQGLSLVRPDGEGLVLGFSLLTREDRETILRVAETEGAHLAAAVLARREQIEEALRAAPAPTANGAAVAYIVLGCISLDWDGLSLAEEEGFLSDPGREGFLPTAYQPAPPETVRQLYWGSHNYTEDLQVTTFGDHYSLPRLGLPDLLNDLNAGTSGPIGPLLKNVARDLVRRHAAALMIALREGARTAAELGADTGIGEEMARRVLGLLLALRYVSESNGRYRAIVPVLTEPDRRLVAELRGLGRQAMREWYQQRHAALSRQLAGLTPCRYGVPLPDSYYWVWHYVFGVANRELVEAGLFADPYDPARTFKGFLPTVIDRAVLSEAP